MGNSQISTGGKKQAIWKSVELRRVDADDLDRIAEVMKNGADGDKASEIMRALTQFTGSGTKAESR